MYEEEKPVTEDTVVVISQVPVAVKVTLPAVSTLQLVLELLTAYV